MIQVGWNNWKKRWC